MERSSLQRRISRILQWVGDVTSRSGAAALVAVVTLVFLLAISAAGFPGRWQTVFATVVASITLVMLFVIQHTQYRHQIALQLKLDELIRSSPHADDHLVHIEFADEAELIERELGQIAHHESVRESHADDVTPRAP
ncbi:MAG: low affinity iron permease family protein [Acidobacteriota bacterium]|nr:low affinity iron permease family protein [Acidobacteriota bacterium]